MPAAGAPAASRTRCALARPYLWARPEATAFVGDALLSGRLLLRCRQRNLRHLVCAPSCATAGRARSPCANWRRSPEACSRMDLGIHSSARIAVLGEQPRGGRLLVRRAFGAARQRAAAAALTSRSLLLKCKWGGGGARRARRRRPARARGTLAAAAPQGSSAERARRVKAQTSPSKVAAAEAARTRLSYPGCQIVVTASIRRCPHLLINYAFPHTALRAHRARAGSQ